MKLRTCLLAIAGFVVVACGGGASVSPPPFGDEATPPSPRLSASAQPNGAQLPDSGALVRVVNLYTDETGAHELDVYGFGGNEIEADKVLVASVGYGAVSDWFDPGFIAGSSGGGRTVSIAVHRRGDPKELAGMSDTTVDPGVQMTVIVQPRDDLGVALRGAFDHRPDTARADVPQAPPDNALLVTSHEGLSAAALEDEVFYASVGDYCLPGKFSDPAIEEILGHPAPQPIGNELVVKPGSHTLTIHRGPADPGEIATCQDAPLANVPLEVESGDRVYAFLYAKRGEREVKVLLVALGD